MKATGPGWVIGQALEKYPKFINDDTSKPDQILLYVQNTYYTPTIAELLQTTDGSPSRLMQTFEDLNITDATVYKNLAVTGLAYFDGDIVVRGVIEVGKDSAGTARISAGDNQTVIIFDKPYSGTPKVVVTMNGLPNFNYGVINKSETGFTIVTSVPVPVETSFDWIAVAQNQITNSSSSTNFELLPSAGVATPSGPLIIESQPVVDQVVQSQVSQDVITPNEIISEPVEVIVTEPIITEAPSEIPQESEPATAP
jgi:hypothetical protein